MRLLDCFGFGGASGGAATAIRFAGASDVLGMLFGLSVVSKEVGGMVAVKMVGGEGTVIVAMNGAPRSLKGGYQRDFHSYSPSSFAKKRQSSVIGAFLNG